MAIFKINLLTNCWRLRKILRCWRTFYLVTKDTSTWGEGYLGTISVTGQMKIRNGTPRSFSIHLQWLCGWALVSLAPLGRVSSRRTSMPTDTWPCSKIRPCPRLISFQILAIWFLCRMVHHQTVQDQFETFSTITSLWNGWAAARNAIHGQNGCSVETR